VAFHPILPADLPEVVDLARRALVDEDGAAARLCVAASGGEVPAAELVVWAWVFSPTREHVLLVDHPRFGVLLPPGGRVDPGESPVAAVRRELREETGLDLGVDAFSRRPALVDWVPGDAFGMAFRCVVDPALPLVSEPGQAASWFPTVSMPSRAEPRHWRRLTSITSK
jgi:8-oxo-dGTP diphosphatase